MSTEITNAQLASDIRQLALELNNIAITLSALLEVTGVDRAKLQATGQRIFEQAVAESDAVTAAQDRAAQTPEQHIVENFNAPGQAQHPKGATIFGG